MGGCCALSVLLLVAFILFVLKKWMPRLWRSGRQSIAPVAGLLALLGLPPVLLLFSYVVQPASIPRYGLPAFGAAAVVAAFLFSKMNRVVVVILVGVACVASGYEFQVHAEEMQESAGELAAYADTIQKLPGDVPILFERRHDLYPFVIYFPELRSRFYFLDFKNSEETAQSLAPSWAFCVNERDSQHVVDAFYPAFQSKEKETLAPGETFVLVSVDAQAVRLRLRFPGAEIRQLQGRVVAVTLPAEAP